MPPGGGVAPESVPPDKRLSARTLGPAGGGVRRRAYRLLEEEYAGECNAASQHRRVRRGVLREEECAGERAAC